jgi:PII-like signaling protein
MKLSGEADRLRIHIGESDKSGGRLLFEVLVEEAQKAGMAGATVLRGVSGFGANSLVHTATILRLSEDMPLVIEIVDRPEKIDAFLPQLDRLVKEGLVTRDRVDVLFYRHNGGRKG